MNLQNKLIKLYNEIDELKNKKAPAIVILRHGKRMCNYVYLVYTEKKVYNLRTLIVDHFLQWLL